MCVCTFVYIIDFVMNIESQPFFSHTTHAHTKTIFINHIIKSKPS